MEAKRIHGRVRLRVKMTAVFIIGNEFVAVSTYARSEIPNVLKFIFVRAPDGSQLLLRLSARVELTDSLTAFDLWLRYCRFFYGNRYTLNAILKYF